MAFTAIVLIQDSVRECITRARALGMEWERTHCHHVTLALSSRAGFPIGEGRRLTVTHAGRIAGRVCAFRVSGAEDSKNSVPHVTVGTSGAGKAKDSNGIESWEEIEPFQIYGCVEICE